MSLCISFFSLDSKLDRPYHIAQHVSDMQSQADMFEHVSGEDNVEIAELQLDGLGAGALTRRVRKA